MIDQKNNNQNPSLFRSFINSSITASSDVQKNYLQVVKNVCETIKKLLDAEKMIINIQYQPKEFWQKAKNFTSCFVVVFANALLNEYPVLLFWLGRFNVTDSSVFLFESLNKLFC